MQIRYIEFSYNRVEIDLIPAAAAAAVEYTSRGQVASVHSATHTHSGISLARACCCSGAAAAVMTSSKISSLRLKKKKKNRLLQIFLSLRGYDFWEPAVVFGGGLPEKEFQEKHVMRDTKFIRSLIISQLQGCPCGCR